MRSFPVYLFDVDGTLLDSASDICGAVLEALDGFRKGITESDLRRYIGFNLIDMFRDLKPDLTQEQREALVQGYRKAYPARGHRMTRVFPGVKDALAALKGRKGTATTKGTPTTRLVLSQFGLIEHFDHIQGTDGIPCKPAPDVLYAALNALSAKPEDCLFVGDSIADMEAGRRAGVKICAVRYGYGDPRELAKWEPDYWVSDLRELLG